MSIFQPKDIIAGLVIVAVVLLKLADKNGILDPVLLLIVGYYFAHRQNGDDNGT